MTGFLRRMSFLNAILAACADTNFYNLTGNPLCGGKPIVSPSEDWVWDRALKSGSWPSCTSPPVENKGQMCEGDPTSVVMQADGSAQCLATQMQSCAFDMHNVYQIDFDVVIWNCVGTWTAPLWLDPHYWDGGPESGELDLVEMCPKFNVQTNFADGGYPKTWPFDGNYAHVHVTMWNNDGDITVKMCEFANKVASCNGDGAA